MRCLRQLAAGLMRTLMLASWLIVPRVFGAISAGDYCVDVWTPENGLPDSSVSAIAQTSDGYLWVGTHNGLARFDGEQFVTFDPANTPALHRARVRKLFVDSHGTLWINTYDGSLTTLRNGTFALERRNLRPSEAELTLVSSSSNRVLFLTSRGDLLRKPLLASPDKRWEELTPPDRGVGALCCEDRHGTVWYCGASGRLWRLTGSRFERLPDSAGLAKQTVNCLTTDARGRLWVGTDHGIAVWDGMKFQPATPTNGPPLVNVTFLFIGPASHIWAVTDGQLGEAIGRRWQVLPVAMRKLMSGDLSHLGALAGRGGGIWFYNFGGGLLHLSAAGRIQELTPREGFPKELINCLFQDREGNVWAGLDARGLIRVRRKWFHVPGEGRGMLPKAAKSVCQDRNGTVWIGTLDNGLECWHNGVMTNLALPGGMEPVYCVCPDAQGRLWISAGQDEELYVREDGLFRQVTPPVRGVKAILAAGDGRIWVGTKSGLCFADPPGHFQAVKNFPHHYVHALAEDDSGAIWAGAGNGDLYRVKGDSVTTFTATNPRLAEAIWSVLPDPDGTIWVGTFRDGLLRLRNGKFTRFTKADGLPDNVICQILEDHRGNLWIGSHHGVFCVAKSALEAKARGEIKTLPVTAFGPDDGLPSLECSGSYQPAAWRGRDGRLWFATTKGVAFIQPANVRRNLTPPPVVIEDFLVDGREFEGGRWQQEYAEEQAHPESDLSALHSLPGLQIPPGTRRFEFRFAGLSLAAPDEVRYRYRLEGFENRWVEAGTQRTAQYSFLPPGKYRFDVIACNSNGVWNHMGAKLTLNVLPYFYETWWFRVLVGVMMMGLVGGTVRYAVTRRLHRKMELLKRQQAIERERTRIAQDLHDDLGASLTLIAVLGDLAAGDKTAERLAKVSNTARQAVKSLDEIVWAVNPGNDTLAHLIDYAGQFATDYLRAAGIRCRLDVPDPAAPMSAGAGREMPANVRHNIFLVIKEALQNIVKHSRATEVWLRFIAGRERLRIMIEDDGCGFRCGEGEPADVWADGLRNMRRRLAEIGGDCTIQSRVGAGTTISVELPWHAD